MKKILLSLAILCTSLLVMAQEPPKVLFVGNSYTEVNNLPDLVEKVAKSTGRSLSHTANTPGGCTFSQHCTNQSMTLIQQGGWDFVVLQEQSQFPSFPQSQVESQCFPYAQILANAVHSVGARPMFYMTWGRRDGDQQNAQVFPVLGTYEGMDSMLYERYMDMAVRNEASVCPVGRVWRHLRANRPDIELYQSDGSHPSMAGSYAAACSFFVMLFHADPAEITFEAELDPAVAEAVRQAVRTVVYDHYDRWYDPAHYTEGGGSTEGISTATSTLSRIYPNPATTQVAIEGPFEILDPMGRILLRGRDHADLTNLPQGLYLVRRPGSTEQLIRR